MILFIMLSNFYYKLLFEDDDYYDYNNDNDVNDELKLRRT